MENKVIYTPSRYSISKAPLLKTTLNEMELNVIRIAEEGMYIEKGKVYIAINEGLKAGEILRIGDLPALYRIVKEKWFTQKGNRRYIIEKLDKSPIQNIDLDNATKGTKIIMVNRQTDAHYLKMILNA